MNFNIEALTNKDLQIVHENTLALLSKYGIALKHEAARKLFYEHGAEVDGEIVRIPPELVMKALSSAPSSFELTARNTENSIQIGKGHPPVFGPAGGTVFVSSFAEERRPAVVQDLRNFLSLSQSSKIVNVACAGLVYPSDVSAADGLTVAMLEAIKISDKPLVGLTQNSEVSEMSINMARIATKGKGAHYVLGIVNSLSPMAWDDKMLGSIMTYASHNQPLVIACCSMAGFTSPTTISATVIQNNAEVLAGIVLSQLVRPGAPVIYGNTSTITDMCTMNLCIGAPEYQLISTACAQLAKHYNIPYRSGGGLTDAKVIDAQTGIEATTNLLFSLANDVDFIFHATGVMESFMTVSYDKWILDEEIIERVLRLKNDRFRLLDNAVDMIGTAISAGSYIEHDDTLDHFKMDFYRTPVSNRSNWDSWKKNERDCQKTAYEICQKRLAAFEAPALSPEILDELQRFL